MAIEMVSKDPNVLRQIADEAAKRQRDVQASINEANKVFTQVDSFIQACRSQAVLLMLVNEIQNKLDKVRESNDLLNIGVMLYDISYVAASAARNAETALNNLNHITSKNEGKK